MSQQIQFRTGDQSLVREINLSVIMMHLLEHASLSRADLAELTGLNKSTVSSLVQELLDLHFVREVGLSSSGVGRPAMQIAINPHAGYIVSCEIGVDFVSVLSANFGSETLWQQRDEHRGTPDQEVILAHALNLLDAAIKASQRARPRSGKLLGLAIGVPGLCSSPEGTIVFAPNLGWRNVPLRRIVQKRFPNVPVFVENEANMGALGEHFFGVAQGCREMLYLSAGVGLGGAVVRDGRLVRGASGFASEFGHMTMKPDGPACNCGNRGCWETLVSQFRVFQLVREAVEAGHASLLDDLTARQWEHLNIPMVANAARQGDRVARSALESVAHQLGIGIASLINALNPDMVVLGGILSTAADLLLPVISQEIIARALLWNRQAVEIVQAQHGTDACVMGGVALVYHSILAKPARHGRQGD